MSPQTGSNSFGELQRQLNEARAGDRQSLEKMLAACREFLLVIAREEIPEIPARESEIQTLVSRALLRVPEVLDSLSATSEIDLHGELRRILLDQLPDLSAQSRRDLASRGHGDGSTRGHDSAGTPEPGGNSARIGASLGEFALASNLADGPPSNPEVVSGARTTPELEPTMPANGAYLPRTGMPQIEGFANISEVAEGGMGIVYRAWQERLKRWVALKCLPDAFAEDPDRLERFRREAVLAAGLTEHGILQVYDVLEVDNTPILVLPYIDGCDLNKLITERRLLREGKVVSDPHPTALLSDRDFVARLLPFFDKVLDALVSLHGAGVLHRDLKPSNILVDRNGNGWLTDFGLARFSRSDTVAQPRQAMGTRGFMSPEQWDGDENIDERTDVFAMGVTIYEALTLELPYGKARITAATPLPKIFKVRQRFLSPEFDLVLLKAIQPDRERRYRSAADLRVDWLRMRKGHLPQRADVGLGRRLRHVARRWAIPILAAAIGLVAVLALIFRQPPKAAPPPKAVRKVLVTTEPPGARLALVPLNAVDGTPEFDKALQPDDKTPVTVDLVPPGDYLVVVEVPGHGFHEVYRRVPEPGEASPSLANKMGFPHTEFDELDGTVKMPLISVPKSEISKEMQLFPGDEFTMGTAEYGPTLAPPHLRSVESFYLDKTEVTVVEFRAVRKWIPEKLKELSPNDAEAVRFVSFDSAMLCAEQMGKRLPDEAEYEYAATNTGKNQFPWGDDFDKIRSWTFGPVGSPAYDRALANPAVCGLFSNIAEWTNSWYAPYPGTQWTSEILAMCRDKRIVRGGPTWVVQGIAAPRGRNPHEFMDPRFRQGIDRDKAFPGLGFRCARSARPRFPQSPGGQKL